jgi:hypothetical protein
MAPEIMEGDTLFIRKPPWAEVKTGSIIAYNPEGGRLIIHRLWKKYPDRFVTRGDRNPGADAPASVAAYRGVLVKIRKKDGREITPGRGWWFRLRRRLGAWLRAKPEVG